MSKSQLLQKGSSSDEYYDEENEDDYDLITLKLHTSTIRVKYWQLCKYSRYIQSKYLKSDVQECLSKEICRFEKENNINEENVIIFFKIFNDEKITITTDRYRDFYKISEFLQVNSFQKRLKKFENRHLNDVDFIITKIIEEMQTLEDQLSSESEFELQMEKQLINKIDECLKNKKFSQIPAPLIYRILEKSDKNQYSSDSLLDFIVGSIDKLFVLLPLVSIQNLSTEKFDGFVDLVLNSNDVKMKSYLQYLPFNFDKFKSLRNLGESNKLLEMEIKQNVDE